MSRKRDEIYEDEEDDDYSLEDIKRDLKREMRKYPKISEEYRVLMQRLTEITECERNEQQADAAKIQKYSWVPNVVTQFAGTLTNTIISYSMNRKTVRDVLDFEDRGNILTTKSQSYIKKP